VAADWEAGVRRFLLFAGPDEGWWNGGEWGPGGGWLHFVADFDGLDAAKAAGLARARAESTDDWWHVVDSTTREIVVNERACMAWEPGV
jgi:hypothetical protein